MERALIGAGGFAREVKAHMSDFNMRCFVDNLYWRFNTDNIFPLSEFDPSEYKVLVTIGDPIDRFNMIQKLPKETQYFSYIHHTVQILGKDVEIGEGSIICAGSIITTNVKIGKHSHINLNTTIGHDCVIGDYFTTAPSVSISGHCVIGDKVYIGTNASLKQEIKINGPTTIGMGACVVKDIHEPGTYIGMPAKKII